MNESGIPADHRQTAFMGDGPVWRVPSSPVSVYTHVTMLYVEENVYIIQYIYIYTKTVYGFKSLKRIWDLETAASATTADYDCGDIITVITVIIINASLRNKPQVPQDRKCRSHVQTDNLLLSQLGYFPMGNSGRCLQGRPVTGNPYDKKYSDKMP